MTTGKMINIEGADFSGKTTLKNSLVQVLESHIPVIGVRAPGEPRLGEFGQRLRNIVVDNPHIIPNPYARQLLFIADHLAMVTEVILPHLEKGTHVISDRFLDSTLAYAVGALQLDEVRIYNLISIVEDAFPENQNLPNRALFLDIPYEVFLSRYYDRKEKDASDIPDKDRFYRIRDQYYKVIDEAPEHYTIIDATQSQDEVLQDALSVLAEPLGYEYRDVTSVGTRVINATLHNPSLVNVP